MSKPEILCGLGKTHRALEDGIPTFGPLLFTIDTLTYKLANFCEKLLKPITTNEYTIKYFFSFAWEVEEFDPDLAMARFDLRFLFTSIPLTEAIDLCV